MHASPPLHEPPRRSFLKFVTVALGGLFGAALGVPIVAFLVDALNRKERETGFKTVARLNELTVGVPKQVVITDTRRDAWTLHPNELIGRVWLVRENEKDVKAFTSICPHLGCSINYAGGEQKLFICPCHNGTFNIEGQKVDIPGMKNPAPRGMDALPLQLVADPANKDDQLVQVEYKKFPPG